MKKLIFFFAIGLAMQTSATVRTVNNNPSGLAQYSDVQTAITASVNGDTIYVHGSNLNYGSVAIINKHLTLIGPGMAPDKQSPLQATFGTIQIQNFNSNGSNTADGSVIIGLCLYGNLEVSSNGSGNNGEPVNNVKVIRSRFINTAIVLQIGNPYGSVTMSGFYAEGNYFYPQGSYPSAGIYANGSGHYNNVVIENNLFCRSDGYWGSGFIGGFVNCNNVRVDHNLFYALPSLGTEAKRCFGAMNGVDIRNNIFENLEIIANDYFTPTSTIVNNIFTNNLTYNCLSNAPWVGNGNVNNGGNISNQNPLMVSQTSIDNGVNNPLLDFRILAGPANNGGADGKDIGLLFDETTPANWTYGRNSRLPYITQVTILNPSVPAGSTLNIQLAARKAK